MNYHLCNKYIVKIKHVVIAGSFQLTRYMYPIASLLTFCLHSLDKNTYHFFINMC